MRGQLPFLPPFQDLYRNALQITMRNLLKRIQFGKIRVSSTF